MLDQFMRRIAAKAGVAPPTPLQVLALYRRAASLPSLKQALEDFGPLGATTGPEAGDGTDTPILQQPNPLDVEQLTLQMQNFEQDLFGVAYSPAEMDALRE